MSKNKIIIAVSLIFCILSILLIVFFDRQAYHKNLNYEFSGKVENVNYDEKGTPNVVIGGKAYYLSDNNWDFHHRVQTNDSLIKRRASMKIILIKHLTKEKIILN